MASISREEQGELAQFSLQCNAMHFSAATSNFYPVSCNPLSTESAFQPLSVPIWLLLLGQNGSLGWRQGSPFLLVARVWCRHGCQGRKPGGGDCDDGQWQLLLTLGIACCPSPPSSSCSRLKSTWSRPRRWNLGLLLSAKVALFPLIIPAAAAGCGRARAGLMWAETLGPTSPSTTIMPL